MWKIFVISGIFESEHSITNLLVLKWLAQEVESNFKLLVGLMRWFYLKFLTQNFTIWPQWSKRGSVLTDLITTVERQRIIIVKKINFAISLSKIKNHLWLQDSVSKISRSSEFVSYCIFRIQNSFEKGSWTWSWVTPPCLDWIEVAMLSKCSFDFFCEKNIFCLLILPT